MLDMPATSISCISVNLIPPAIVVAEDLTKTKPWEGSPNVVLTGLSSLGKQATCESTDTRNSGGPGVSKDKQPSSSQQGSPTVPLGVPALAVAEPVRAGRTPLILVNLLPMWP